MLLNLFSSILLKILHQSSSQTFNFLWYNCLKLSDLIKVVPFGSTFCVIQRCSNIYITSHLCFIFHIYCWSAGAFSSCISFGRLYICRNLSTFFLECSLCSYMFVFNRPLWRLLPRAPVIVTLCSFQFYLYEPSLFS